MRRLMTVSELSRLHFYNPDTDINQVAFQEYDEKQIAQMISDSRLMGRLRCIHQNDEKYSSRQKKQISLGEKNGLSLKQVDIYSDPRLSVTQMYYIRKGLEAENAKRASLLYRFSRFFIERDRRICRTP